MSEWVRTDIDFDEPGAILYCGQREFVARVGVDVRELLRRNGDAPAVIEAALTDIIEEHRPDLAGFVLYGMRFDFGRLEWQFAVGHRGLPRRKQGEEYQRMPLFPDAETRVVTPEEWRTATIDTEEEVRQSMRAEERRIMGGDPDARRPRGVIHVTDRRNDDR